MCFPLYKKIHIKIVLAISIYFLVSITPNYI